MEFLVENNDKCIRGIADQGRIRFYIAKTTGIVAEAKRRHDTSPVVTIALGRMLTAAALMGQMLKSERESLTLRIQSDGPIGSLTALSDISGAVRGYAGQSKVFFEDAAAGRVDLAAAMGLDGQLTVIKDLGLKEPYTGTVRLETGAIGDELAHYFLLSEQTQSAVGLSVLLTEDGQLATAGGYILQLMPGADEQTAIALEKNLAACHPISPLFAKGYSLEQLADMLLAGFEPQVLAIKELCFACNCERKRLEKVLRSMSAEELRSCLEEQGQIEAECRFCGEKYIFEESELKAWLN